jgi:hypothetical protein
MAPAGTAVSAGDIVSLLEQGTLFTDLAAKVTGAEITFEVQAREVRGLDGEQRRCLHAWRDGVNWGVQRTCAVQAGGTVIAHVSSLYLPTRLPTAARRTLAETDESLGAVVQGIGGWREHQGARQVHDRGAIVRSHGRLVLPGPGTSIPVALAWEEVLGQLLAVLRP